MSDKCEVSDTTDTSTDLSRSEKFLTLVLIAVSLSGIFFFSAFAVPLAWDTGRNFFASSSPVIERTKSGMIVTLTTKTLGIPDTYTVDFITGNKEIRYGYSKLIVFEMECDCVTNVGVSGGRHVTLSTYSGEKVWTSYGDTEPALLPITPLLQNYLDKGLTKIREMEARFPQ